MLAHPETAPPSTGGETLERVGSRKIGDNAFLFGVGDRFDRAVRGQPLPDDLGGVLLREPGPQVAISLVKVPSLETAWTITLPNARRAESAMNLVHCAGTIVLKRGAELEAFDLKSGVPLWSRTFDRTVQDVGAGGGVVLVTLSTPPKEGSDPPPAAIAAFEPRTGVELFTAVLAGIDTRVGQLLPQGDLCVVSSYLRSTQTAEVFDVVSGARRLEPRPFVSGATVPLLLPDVGVLALPSSGSTASSRLGGVARLVGWRLDDDSKAFEFEMLPLQYKLRWLLPVAEGLAIYGGTPPNSAVALIDPRDGARVGDPTPMPPEISELARVCRMVGEEPRVRVLGFGEFRKGDPFFSLSLLAGNGKPLWPGPTCRRTPRCATRPIGCTGRGRRCSSRRRCSTVGRAAPTSSSSTRRRGGCSTARASRGDGPANATTWSGAATGWCSARTPSCRCWRDDPLVGDRSGRSRRGALGGLPAAAAPPRGNGDPPPRVAAVPTTGSLAQAQQKDGSWLGDVGFRQEYRASGEGVPRRRHRAVRHGVPRPRHHRDPWRQWAHARQGDPFSCSAR